MKRHVRTALQAPGRIAAPSLKLRSFPDVKEQETSAVDYTAGDMIFFYCDSPCLQGSICSRRES
ncbi:hypothetical protein Bca52824_078298 [Brassica carinata]|uniref:Uncharacterized protein n=1 Tax=Brassica carinata TaxID=52824 RepID=A0A8X7TZ08_BRACI|nr:hypothetical protein Bca52824_078298 [Brassica carinata]